MTLVDRGSGIRPLAAVAPFVIVALAALAVRTPLAAAYPRAAALLFLWIAADTMMLSLAARSSGRPPWRDVLAVLAAASVVVWLGSPAAVRAGLWATPAIAVGMALPVLAHLGWGAVRAGRVLAVPGGAAGDRWVAAASAVLPPVLVRLAVAEWRVIHTALFRWGVPADVPADCRAFAYHRHLAPICATLLILSAIEMTVYHLLIAHWNRTVAIALFVMSDVGFVYLVGLIKSFRLRPILLTPDGIRIRAGFLIDQFVPLGAIAAVERHFPGEAVRDPATLNAALLAWPNLLLRLDPPVVRRSLIGRRRTFGSVAFRLDDPDAFVRLLRWRMGLDGG